MATPVPAFEYYSSRGVNELLTNLLKYEGWAYDNGFKTLSRDLGKIADHLIAGINTIAKGAAAGADASIIRHMRETHGQRPFQGEMETHVKSEAEPGGWVNVALLSELDKIVNPQGGYREYWRAQEYGTGVTIDYGPQAGEEIPSQTGRVLFGTFESSGTPPNPESDRKDVAFHPQGRNPGWGTIHEELDGRHFLLDGWLDGGEMYLRKTEELKAAVREAIEAATIAAKAEIRRSRSTNISLSFHA